MSLDAFRRTVSSAVMSAYRSTYITKTFQFHIKISNLCSLTPILLTVHLFPVTGEVGCTGYSFICLYLLELQNGSPNASLQFYGTKHL